MPAGCLALAGFAFLARRTPEPILPPAALRDRPLLTGTLVVGVANALVTPVLLLCTGYVQEVAGLGAAVTGLLFVPFNLAVIAGSLLATRMPGRRRTGVMALAIGGIACGAAILLLLPAAGAFLVPLLTAFTALGLGGGAASVAANTEATAAVAVLVAMCLACARFLGARPRMPLR